MSTREFDNVDKCVVRYGGFRGFWSSAYAGYSQQVFGPSTMVRDGSRGKHTFRWGNRPAKNIITFDASDAARWFAVGDPDTVLITVRFLNHPNLFIQKYMHKEKIVGWLLVEDVTANPLTPRRGGHGQ